MTRQTRVELVALVLYLFVFLAMDKPRGLRTAARCVRWYGDRCRSLGNAFWMQAFYSDRAYQELIAP